MLSHRFSPLMAGFVFGSTVLSFIASSCEAVAREPLPPFEQATSPKDGNASIRKLDAMIRKTLKEKGLEPAPLCSDAVFMRRVTLDLTGTIPRSWEVLAFLNDKRPEKRILLIDKLLQSEEFIDYQAMRWSDVLRIKAEFPINLWPHGAAVYYRWVRQAVRANMPYDKFARELVTASGSNFRDPPSNFYRAVPERDAENIAETVALTFLGQRTGPWPEEKRKKLAAFFSRITFKASDEWKEEIVQWTRVPLDNPELEYPDGKKISVPADKDPREVFAQWLTRKDNKQFARCGVNRVWYWLFGRGLVQEPDDFREDNPPVHPELLDALASAYISAGYDTKQLYRVILNSHTYQQSSIPSAPHAEAETLFACYPVRRLEAEALQDVLCRIFRFNVGYTSEIPEPYAYVPGRRRTIQLADASVTGPFLEMFGRSTRDSGMEVDRNNGVTESQRMFFLNSTEVNNWVAKFVRDYYNYADKKRDMIDELWLSLLSRRPTEEERKIATDMMKTNRASAGPAAQDIVWSLVNSKEFLCRH